LFGKRVAQSGTKPAMRYKAEGSWKSLSWNDWHQASLEIAAGLAALGIAKGDRVCLLANTRPEWFMCDIGVLMAGAATVPIYQSNTPEQCQYIVDDSGARVVIAENAAQAAKVKNVKIVTMDAADGATTLATLRESGRKWLGDHAGALERTWEAIEPTQMFTIVYTSGTTGPPKGVVLLHSNMTFETEALTGALALGPHDEQLLFLPLAHIFAKILMWSAIEGGALTSFAQSINTLKDDLAEVRPTFMGAVPRVYEKFYAGIQQNVKDSSPTKQKIFRWATRVGAEASRKRQSGQRAGGFRFWLANKLVFSKLKKRLGLDNTRFLISGGAPLAREIAEFFHSLDVLVVEGYGLTETTAATHVNHPRSYRIGSVGQSVPGIEVKIADDGEILMRGGNIMKEYYKKPADTRAVLDPDGWFHSGDIGVVEDGFLRITDRKKDLIVTAGGKNVAPQNLEGALKARCPYVSQVMVHGDNRKFLTALITAADDAIAKLGSRAAVEKEIASAVEALNKELPSYETIKKFAVLEKDFSQETGELTPTLKVKRKVVTEKYRSVLDAFYT
jgi:long-chain acyl-CoA synthetase